MHVVRGVARMCFFTTLQKLKSGVLYKCDSKIYHRAWSPDIQTTTLQIDYTGCVTGTHRNPQYSLLREYKQYPYGRRVNIAQTSACIVCINLDQYYSGNNSVTLDISRISG